MNKGLKILVVEDDANIALALTVLLRRAFSPVVVTCVSDGQQAKVSLCESDYELIISDWNMPFMTGLELLSFVRASPKIKRLPFLMLTARTDVSNYSELSNVDITVCIGKPFDTDEFVGKIKQLLGR